VKLKFRVVGVTDDGTKQVVTMRPVGPPPGQQTGGPNAAIADGHPDGEIRLTITNPTAFNAFLPGEIDVDFHTKR
jgi:hypothetical protein